MPIHTHRPRQIPGLIEAPLFQAFLAHRHPGDGVKLPGKVLCSALGHKAAKAFQGADLSAEFEVQYRLAHRPLIIKRCGTPGKGRLLHGMLPGKGQGLAAMLTQQLLSCHRAAEGTAPGHEEIQYAPCGFIQ